MKSFIICLLCALSMLSPAQHVVEDYDFHATVTTINRIEQGYQVHFIDGNEQGDVIIDSLNKVTTHDDLIHICATVIEDEAGKIFTSYTIVED